MKEHIFQQTVAVHDILSDDNHHSAIWNKILKRTQDTLSEKTPSSFSNMTDAAINAVFLHAHNVHLITAKTLAIMSGLKIDSNNI